MTSIAGVEPTRDLLGGANRAAAVADEHAEQGDRQGQLSAPVVEALNREGLFGMWVPRSVRGGAELDPISVASRHRERFLRRPFRRLGADGGGARHWHRRGLPWRRSGRRTVRRRTAAA